MLDGSECLMRGCTANPVQLFCMKHLLEPQIDQYKFRETTNNYKTRTFIFIYNKPYKRVENVVEETISYFEIIVF